MSFVNKTTITIFSIFFLLVCHLWYEAHGIVGLGIQQNNLTWLFVTTVIGLSFFIISKYKKIIIPDFWWKGGIAIIVVLIPFAVGNKEFFSQGYLLPLGLVFVWFFVLSVIQFEVFRNKPEFLALLLLACITIQVVWGFLETFHGVMFNLTHGKVLMDPAALGVFNQRNTFGSFLATGLALSLFIFTKYNYDNNKLQKASYYWHLIFLLLASFTIVFSNSRAAYIGSILGVLLVFPYALQASKKKTLIWLVVGCVGLLTALVLLNATGRVEKELTEGGARVGMYLTSLHLIFDAPLFGNGLGSFQNVFLEKFAELYQAESLPEGSGHGNLVHPHNELLLWGVEGGAISIIGLLALAFLLIRALWGKRLKTVAILGLLFPIVFHSMVEMPFYQSALHLIVLTLLFVSGYYLVRGGRDERSYPIKKTKVFPVLSGLITLSAIVVFALNIISLNTFNSFLNDQNRDLNKLQDVYVDFGWEATHDYIYFASLSQLGIRNNKPELSQPLIEWGEKMIERAPKLDYFMALIYAYENVGDIQGAYKTVRKLDYYYPTHPPTQEWKDNFYNHMKAKGYKEEDYID